MNLEASYHELTRWSFVFVRCTARPVRELARDGLYALSKKQENQSNRKLLEFLMIILDASGIMDFLQTD